MTVQVTSMIDAGGLTFLKTAMGGDTHRGFESHALRSDLPDQATDQRKRPSSRSHRHDRSVSLSTIRTRSG